MNVMNDVADINAFDPAADVTLAISSVQTAAGACAAARLYALPVSVSAKLNAAAQAMRVALAALEAASEALEAADAAGCDESEEDESEVDEE